jgi:hypothetical protein
MSFRRQETDTEKRRYHGFVRNYYKLLPYVFRRFSVLSAFRTALPTASYSLRRPALPASDKPALFTMNILPPMMTVWHHLARKSLGDAVDIVIFDCSGRLDPAAFPGARVQKFLNFYASTKCDEFLYRIARNRRIGWLCDDDVFFAGPQALSVLTREFAVPGTASVSFRPRGWWYFDIDGKRYEASSSYCIAYDRSIFCEKEKLSLAPANGNTHPARNGKGTRRYDTGDLSNELLLRHGYRCAIVDEEEQKRCILPFTGVSSAVMLLNYFRRPEETIDYFLTPDPEKWGGNVLYGVFAAMLAVSTVQECHERLTGKSYPLPALPSRSALDDIRKKRESFLREGNSFDWVDDVSDRLRAAL